MCTPSKNEKIEDINVSDTDDEEGEIRFEMYSPEDDNEHIRVRQPLGIRQAVTNNHDFADKGLFEGMKDFLSDKKKNFTENVSGFLGKLE